MNTERSQCPHIQLLDADIYQQGAPQALYRELRLNHPVCKLEDPYSDGSYWAVTRQEHLDFVSKNPKLFSSEAMGIMPEDDRDEEQLELIRKLMIAMDPPQHLKYRRIVRNAFTPGAVDSYGPHFSDLARDIVAKVLPQGECEFVSELASELPLIAICEILGVPREDRQQFFQWSNTLIGEGDPEYSASQEDRTNATIELYFYADKIRELNSADPKEDIVGAMLRGTVDGEHLNEEEFRNLVMLLIVAGNETTRNQISHLMRLLIEHPEQYQMLVDDPSRVADAVEEGLRYNSPVITFRRTVMQDIELNGQQLHKGDKVMLFYQSASRDEANFSDPDRFDITRPRREAVRENLRAFGIGEHFCLGSHLARLELNMIMSEIVRHIRNPRHTGETAFLHSHSINGIKRMPIAFDTV